MVKERVGRGKKKNIKGVSKYPNPISEEEQRHSDTNVTLYLVLQKIMYMDYQRR